MSSLSASESQVSIWSRIDRAWRIFATGLSFTLFGVGGVLLGTVIIPATWLVVRNRQKRILIARVMVTGAFKGFGDFMRMVRVLDYRFEGLDRLGDLSRCLIVANHPTLIDVVFLLSIFRRAECLVKRSHWSNPFTMGPIQMSDYLSNADLETMLGESVKRLQAGGHLVMFPEGSRTVPGQPIEFHRGAANIAVGAGADCLAIRIRCTPSTLTKAEPWYHVPSRRMLFEVIVLERISADEILEDGDSPRQAAIKLTQRLQQLYSKPLEDGGQRPSN